MSLHGLCYPGIEPPRCAQDPVFPTDEQISPLFVQPFLPGTPRTPDRLTPEAYVDHNALKRSLLYRVGNAESITGLQQWLLLHIMTH